MKRESFELFAARPSGTAALLLLAGTALSAAGCSTAPAGSTGRGVCKDADLGWAIGQKAEESVMRRLSEQSGAGLVNPIGPYSNPLRDTRKDRLRVYIDKDNTITRVRCE